MTAAAANGTTNGTNGHARKKAQAPTPPVPALAERTLYVDVIAPDPLNPRKHFDEAKLAELAASIEKYGVLQPILVRPPAADAPSGPFRIVAGERRWRAARIAGARELPCRVVDLDDRAALEVMVIENEQREDVSPLEKAEGYGVLVDRFGHTVETIAAKVGKSETTVRALLRLRQLPDVARRALESGRLNASTAELVARVPGAKSREEFARRVLMGEEGDYGEVPTDEDLADAALHGWEPMSYRDAKELLERRFMVELKGAPFDRADAKLLPEAGSCKLCPKRCGNNPAEYPGARADVCTDPDCFRSKVEAHAKRAAERARAKGRTVIEGADAEKLFWGEQLKGSAPYVELSAACWEDPQQRTYKDLLGGACDADVVVAIDPKGGAHELVPRERAAEVLKKEHGVKARPAAADTGGDDRWKREQAERRRKAEAGREAAARACALVAAEAEKRFAAVVNWGTTPALLKAMAAGLASALWHEVRQRVIKRRGVDEDLRKYAASLDDPRALMGFLAELMAARYSLNWSSEYSGGPDDEERAFFAAWGVDPKALIKEVVAEKKAGKGKKPGLKKAAEAAAAKPADPAPVPVPAAPADWRGTGLDLVGCLDLGDVAHLEKAHGIRTLGQLSDRFDFAGGVHLGLKARVAKKLQAHLDRVRPAGAGPVTRDTTLAALLPAGAPAAAFEALDLARLVTVADLVARAKTMANGEGAQKAYVVLKHLIGFPADCVFAVCDRLVDAGLIGPELGRAVPGALPPAPPPADEPGWRRLPVADLELPAPTAVALGSKGVATVGELADRLDADARGLGFNKKTTARLVELVELARCDDSKVGKSETFAKRSAARSCRLCGCTDTDCRGCVERTGMTCLWVEEDLCSACEGKTAEEVRAELDALRPGKTRKVNA